MLSELLKNHWKLTIGGLEETLQGTITWSPSLTAISRTSALRQIGLSKIELFLFLFIFLYVMFNVIIYIILASSLSISLQQQQLHHIVKTFNDDKVILDLDTFNVNGHIKMVLRLR